MYELTARYILFNHATPNSETLFGNSSIPSRNACLVKVDMQTGAGDFPISFFDKLKELTKRETLNDDSEVRWRLSVWTPSASLLMFCKLYSPLTALIYLLVCGYTGIIVGIFSSVTVRFIAAYVKIWVGASMFQELVADREILHGELMNEFTQKFVYKTPAFRATDDAATGTDDLE